MGTGIAQVAAVKGLDVVLTDSSQQALDRSIVYTERGLRRLVAKEKLTQEQADAAVQRINVQNDLQVR
jgi:3-hydroxyacyl-CoA dehydrogenase